MIVYNRLWLVLIYCLLLQVSDIETRSAVIQLSPPECNGPPISLDIQDCQYELLLSDKGCDAKYKMVFW